MTGRRLLVALVVLPALYLAVRHLPPSGFFGLVAVAALLGQYEFYRLCALPAERGLTAAGLLLGLLLLWSMSRMSVSPLGAAGLFGAGARLDGLPVAAAFTAIVLGGLLLQLAAGREIGSSLVHAAVMAFGALYVVWLLGHLLLLRALVHGAEFVLFVLLVTWTTDSLAYFGGRRFGRRPLAPRISPNKTVEGAVAGLLGGVGAAFLGRWWLLDSLSAGEALTAGLLLGCVGQVGDLCESMVKRGAGVKDSGAWIPGHGGLLDKVDSLVFTAPTFYYYLVLVKGYGRLFVV